MHRATACEVMGDIVALEELENFLDASNLFYVANRGVHSFAPNEFQSVVRAQADDGQGGEGDFFFTAAAPVNSKDALDVPVSEVYVPCRVEV